MVPRSQMFWSGYYFFLHAFGNSSCCIFCLTEKKLNEGHTRTSKNEIIYAFGDSMEYPS